MTEILGIVVSFLTVVVNLATAMNLGAEVVDSLNGIIADLQAKMDGAEEA